MNNDRTSFNSKLGVILATAGSAVGIGNIWRFPYMVGENGGAAFIMIYILCILILGLPVMITELYIGKSTQLNTTGAIKSLAPRSAWSIIGYNGVLAAFLIFGFYSVVAGWTLKYLFLSLTGKMTGGSVAEFQDIFNQFSTSTYEPILYMFIIVMLSHAVITMGVDKGIEKASKLLMPLLFVLLLILGINSLTLTGAGQGLLFLFKPDFNKIDSSVVLSAMGQAFFSMSIGMGCLITYGSYFRKDINLQTVSLQVGIVDCIVAILAGIIIFPAVFSFGIEPSAGPELVFITLPNIFGQISMGSVWSSAFFLLLAVAALTSTISLHEVATSYLHEEKRISRKRAALIVSAGVITLGTLSSLSMGIGKDTTIFGLNFFSLLDFVTAKLMLPIGGLLVCIFTAKRIDKKILKSGLTVNGTIPFYFFNTYYFIIKWIAPVLISLVFFYELI